jgi:5-methylcytosine-specific restriction protein A
MPQAIQVCSQVGCPALVPGGGKCGQHKRAAEAARGSAAQRGYGGKRWRAARRAVLRRDRVCVLCHTAEATVADHHPISRRELVAIGVTDPDAPSRMRGLCASCHGKETARESPGGFNRRD